MKIERLLFIGLMIVVFFTTMLEGAHDYYVISDINGNPDRTELWKLTGNMYSIIWICLAVGLCAVSINKWRLLIWIPTLMFIWWLVHDLTIGLFLTGDPFYIGMGDFDQFWGRIMQQSGIAYAIWKLIWIFFGIGASLKLSKES